LKRLFDKKDDQDVITSKIAKLSGLLEESVVMEKKPKERNRANLPSDKTLFNEQIVPQIMRKLAEYERMDLAGKPMETKVSLLSL
jgi:hypothetical protein